MNNFFNYEGDTDDTDVNSDLVAYVIENSYRDSTGRLVMPALWNRELLHLLPNNYPLARQVLHSLFKKFHKFPNKLNQYDAVIQQQLLDNIIEEVPDYENIIGLNGSSFIAHNAIFKDSSSTTKCRIVLLSNLCEKGESNLSHNQVSLPGPNLNSKSYISCILLRFNKFLLIWDIVKAFLQLKMPDEDSNKLNFLWFKNVKDNDFTEVCYRIRRVPFGMRFSATLLMLALYIILIVNSEPTNSNINNTIFNLSYMDNLAYSSNSEDNLINAFEVSKNSFNSYGFKLQKYFTNSQEFLSLIHI